MPDKKDYFDKIDHETIFFYYINVHIYLFR